MGCEKSTSADGDRKWRDAYLTLRQDAAIGRHFKGILHNLNGVVQAFSMQAELLAMMFDRTFALLDGIDQVSPEEKKSRLTDLLELLRKRSQLAGQMGEKVQACQSIVSMALPPVISGAVGGADTLIGGQLNSALRTEVEFLLADAFFKHRVEKQLELAEGLAEVAVPSSILHHVFAFVLENALAALRDTSPAILRVVTIQERDTIQVLIEHSGTPLPEASAARVFEPFFSTYTGDVGLGLHLVGQLVSECGGEVRLENGGLGVRIVLLLPVVSG